MDETVTMSVFNQEHMSIDGASYYTQMQHCPAMYTLTIIICQTADCYSLYVLNDNYSLLLALSAACVHSTYHTPNKEIVIGRCGIRECMHA